MFQTAGVREAEGAMSSAGSIRDDQEANHEADVDVVVAFNALPEESIEGQNGLIKHILLNDRRRVLTLDTAGEVVMWDLVKCEPVQSFGKRHLEDVAPQVNTMESVANWCAVDTRTGRLACVLEENYCFDAEMYADELGSQEGVQFREDQRINLGKWVLRYLFANLIDEEIRRDDMCRKSIGEAREGQTRVRRENAPTSIPLPASNMNSWQDASAAYGPENTPRAVNGMHHLPTTPGLAIGFATPGIAMPHAAVHHENTLAPTAEEGSEDKRSSQHSQPRSSSDRSHDYFSGSNNVPASSTGANPEINTKNLATSTEGHEDQSPKSPSDADKDSHGKEGGSLFGKKFRMSFGSKKLGRSPSVDTSKPVLVDEKVEDSDSSNAGESKDESVEDNLFGVVQEIRREYHRQFREHPSLPVSMGILPSMPNETPVLKPPGSTTVIIQEDSPDSGGVADLYRGTVASVGRDADVVEKAAPMWLGRLLLCNQTPQKDTVKVSFVLQPYQDLLPSIASIDGNSRLNANRMLRARKILGYVAERIEPQNEKTEGDALKPEDYLELYCQNQLVPRTTTLATLRAHIWKTGGDVMLYYKSNGRKKILGEKMAPDGEVQQ